jgi:uncharacterized membrane protein
MSDRHKHPHSATSTARIEALTDGVFAIIMTLLVFDLRVPNVPVEELPAALLAMGPSFLGYTISFVVLGVYWIGHRAQFNYIKRADQNLYWLNILFFAFSALVPFATGLTSRYPGDWLTDAIYGFNLILIGVSLYLHWLYATRHHRLVDPDLPAFVIRFATLRCLVAPAFYAVAIVVGLINPLFSLVFYALVPLLYVVPAFQRLWMAAAKLGTSSS